MRKENVKQLRKTRQNSTTLSCALYKHKHTLTHEQKEFTIETYENNNNKK